jgi:hypothetical protein
VHHLPPPNGFTHRDWWLAIKMSRRAVYRLPFADSQRVGFNYSVPDNLFKLLQYARAYLYTETDDNDLTHFIDHQLNVICEAIKALHKYLAEKTREIADTRRLIASSP